MDIHTHSLVLGESMEGFADEDILVSHAFGSALEHPPKIDKSFINYQKAKNYTKRTPPIANGPKVIAVSFNLRGTILKRNPQTTYNEALVRKYQRIKSQLNNSGYAEYSAELEKFETEILKAFDSASVADKPYWVTQSDNIDKALRRAYEVLNTEEQEQYTDFYSSDFFGDQDLEDMYAGYNPSMKLTEHVPQHLIQYQCEICNDQEGGCAHCEYDYFNEEDECDSYDERNEPDDYWEHEEIMRFYEEQRQTDNLGRDEEDVLIDEYEYRNSN
jgi:hypothetical protein